VVPNCDAFFSYDKFWISCVAWVYVACVIIYFDWHIFLSKTMIGSSVLALKLQTCPVVLQSSNLKFMVRYTFHLIYIYFFVYILLPTQFSS